jgi:transcriptional regulator with XRE-family HTH domain
MKKKGSSVSYLRFYRRRWGLSQRELAELLGWTKTFISRVEKRKRAPSLELVIGCFILFGTPPAEIFPEVADRIETVVMARIWDLYERLQGDCSRKTKAKIELLEDAIRRASERKTASASHPHSP